MATNLVSSPSVLVIYSIVKRATNLVSSHVSVRLLNYIKSNIPINLLNGWHLLFLLFMQTLLCRGAAIPLSAKFSVCEPCISPFLGIITMTTEDSAKFGVCAPRLGGLYYSVGGGLLSLYVAWYFQIFPHATAKGRI